MVGSRLLPLTFALAAFGAGVAGSDGLAFVLVLAAIPCAAAAAFVAVSDALEGREARMRAVSTSLALSLLVIGCTVRASAPRGGHVPPFAVSTLVAAVLLYTVPALFWVLEPLRPRPRASRVHARTLPGA
ncbi:MAG TPA: hypothetical protein VMT74_01460 [Gaiellaceae bacterium]|nr:hypothetical protein [Gaiellaceae bacterium]